MSKNIKMFIVRAYKAGLSIEACAWVFCVTASAVHKIIREAL